MWSQEVCISVGWQIKIHQKLYQATFSATITTHDCFLPLLLLQILTEFSSVNAHCTANVSSPVQGTGNYCPLVAQLHIKFKHPTRPTLPYMCIHLYTCSSTLNCLQIIRYIWVSRTLTDSTEFWNWTCWEQTFIAAYDSHLPRYQFGTSSVRLFLR